MPPSTFAIHAKISGKITAEEHAVIPRSCTVKSKCSIGAFSYLGTGTVITQTRIGRYCSIATNVVISPTDHPTDRFTTHPLSFNKNGCFKNSEAFQEIKNGTAFPTIALPITTIGHDVWIGANVVIKRGLTIGNGAIIGAGSVVTKDVAPYTIVGGIPAKLIRPRFEADIIQRLQALKWWHYDLSSCALETKHYDDINLFLEHMEKAIANRAVRKFSCKKQRFPSAIAPRTNEGTSLLQVLRIFTFKK